MAGAASERWRALVEANHDGHGRRRDGHDAVRERPAVRRPARGLEPDPARGRPADPPRLSRGRLADPADQHVRRQPAAARPASASRTASPSSTRPPRSCSAPRSRRAGGGALVAGDIGPSGAIIAPIGTLDYDEAVDIFAEQAAAAGRRRRRPHLDRDDVRPDRDQGRHRGRPPRVARASPLITTMTFDTRGRTMMGVTPEQAVAALAAWGADAVGGNCGNGPDELLAGHRADARRATRRRSSSPSRTPGCPSWSTCAPSTAPIPTTMAAAGARDARGRRARSSAAAAAARPTTSGRSRRSSHPERRHPRPFSTSGYDTRGHDRHHPESCHALSDPHLRPAARGRRGHRRPPRGLGPPPPRPRPADLPRPARPARDHPGRHRQGRFARGPRARRAGSAPSSSCRSRAPSPCACPAPRTQAADRRHRAPGDGRRRSCPRRRRRRSTSTSRTRRSTRASGSSTATSTSAASRCSAA